MTDKEVQAADIIVGRSSLLGLSASNVFDTFQQIEGKVNEMKNAAIILQHEGFIEIEIYQGKHTSYKLTPPGLDFQKTGKGYGVYLKEKDKKLKTKSEKEKRDDYHKSLQIQDLEIKLKSVEEMQERQKIFWESGIATQKRQRWQFWLMFFFAAAGFLLGIINFIKSMILS